MSRVPSGVSFFRYLRRPSQVVGKAIVSSLANCANDKASSSSEDRRFRPGKEEGRNLRVVGSEEGSELSGNPAGVVGPCGGPLLLFSLWSSTSWDWRRASRSRLVSFHRVARSSFSLKRSSAVGHGRCLVERFRMPILLSAMVLIDTALASWNCCATVVFSSTRF